MNPVRYKSSALPLFYIYFKLVLLQNEGQKKNVLENFYRLPTGYFHLYNTARLLIAHSKINYPNTTREKIKKQLTEKRGYKSCH